MSLPIPTSILVRGATTLASDVAKRVGQAIGFAEVLAGADSGDADSARSQSLSDAPGLVQQIVQQIVQTAGQTLSRSRIALNQPLQLSVQADGGLQVEGDHPRAAEIEALLASDVRLQELAHQLVRVSGSSGLAGPGAAIGLTIPGGQESILRTSGGYPNW